MSVLIETSFGDIVIDLYPQRCPNACLNFVKLCKRKFYNNALFAEVQKDYVAEIKTPKSSTIWNELTPQKQRTKQTQYFKDQLDMQLRMNMLGLVATSNKGANLNNSDFFITLTKAHLTSLDGKHTVFGKVEEGFQILKKINQIYVDKKFRPQLNIRILHTYILQDPFENKFQRMQIPQSPKLIEDSERLQAVEHFEMLSKNKTQVQMMEAIRQHKAKKQAVTLQILGDIADADIKPPDNILFICKLNPITQQRDLQVIFSRFGPIKSVQIVRDWKTGTSLQYGFVQFESPNACQQAYLKMENVLIDDRRIHVDFSQSVQKLMPKNKLNKYDRNQARGQHRQKNKQLVLRNKQGKSYYNSQYDLVGSKLNLRQNNQRIQDIKEAHEKLKQKKQQMVNAFKRRQSKSKSISHQRKRSRQRQRSRSKHKKQKTKNRKRSYSSSQSRQHRKKQHKNKKKHQKKHSK